MRLLSRKGLIMTFRNFIHLFISLICIFSSSIVFAEKPFDMAKDTPTQVWPGKHGLNTHIAELDIRGAAEGSEFLIIDLPDGSVVDLQRDDFKRHGQANHTVWIGKAVDYPDSRVVLTVNNGIMSGRLRINENVYEIRIRANEYNNGVAADKKKNYVVEQLNLDSFPEIDEDSVSISESDVFIADAPADSTWTTTPATAGDAMIIIDLMSLYTPATRSAAGGVANIEATTQSAVDVSNAAFADSGMNVQYRLVHMAESSYNESSSSIKSDLDWVANDADVAALRDQYGADVVSLIIENGGDYCGYGYIQRSPKASFAPYAFQV